MIAGYRKVPGGKSRQQKAGHPAQAGDHEDVRRPIFVGQIGPQRLCRLIHPKGVIKTSEKR